MDFYACSCEKILWHLVLECGVCTIPIMMQKHIITIPLKPCKHLQQQYKGSFEEERQDLKKKTTFKRQSQES